MSKKIKLIATSAIKKAGKYALKKYKKFDRKETKLKKNQETLTKVDLGVEKIILKEIKKNFPDHGILSEESGNNNRNSDYLWIIDPIDGTTNFSMHNPLWGISVGLVYKDKIILGLIYAPVLDELYLGELGKGAYLNNKRLKVSDVSKGRIFNTLCHSRHKKDVKKAVKFYAYQKLNNLGCRHFGTAALELAYVAGGRIESFIFAGAHIWDIAAGVLLVKEAGGHVTDFKGKTWSLESNDIVASNGKVHRKVINVLNKI